MLLCSMLSATACILCRAALRCSRCARIAPATVSGKALAHCITHVICLRLLTHADILHIACMLRQASLTLCEAHTKSACDCPSHVFTMLARSQTLALYAWWFCIAWQGCCICDACKRHREDDSQLQLSKLQWRQRAHLWGLRSCCRRWPCSLLAAALLRSSCVLWPRLGRAVMWIASKNALMRARLPHWRRRLQPGRAWRRGQSVLCGVTILPLLATAFIRSGLPVVLCNGAAVNLHAAYTWQKRS